MNSDNHQTSVAGHSSSKEKNKKICWRVTYGSFLEAMLGLSSSPNYSYQWQLPFPRFLVVHVLLQLNIIFGIRGLSIKTSSLKNNFFFRIHLSMCEYNRPKGSSTYVAYHWERINSQRFMMKKLGSTAVVMQESLRVSPQAREQPCSRHNPVTASSQAGHRGQPCSPCKRKVAK